MSSEPRYYDWQKTLSYDADVTMVVGARGIGKTYGIRKQCIRDFLKDGSRFVEVVRFKNELADVAEGYFDRVGKEFSGYVFRTDARAGYIAVKPSETKDEKKKPKPQWRKICYFLSMTEAQKKKKKTYDNVRRIIFDEAVLEKTDRYHTYLNSEPTTLAKLVDTVSRERPDVKSIRPRVYLLGNACDLSNPYFAYYKVGTDLKFGYRWYSDKTFLLHYADAGDYATDKLEKTVAGRMLRGSIEGRINAENKFVGVSAEFVRRKPSRAKFSFGIACNGKRYGIWLDMQGGYYYVSDRLPRNANSPTFDRPIYALTMEDNRINYIAAKKADRVLQYFSEMYYMGYIRYETLQVKSDFIEVLTLFGIR